MKLMNFNYDRIKEKISREYYRIKKGMSRITSFHISCSINLGGNFIMTYFTRMPV